MRTTRLLQHLSVGAGAAGTIISVVGCTGVLLGREIFPLYPRGAPPPAPAGWFVVLFLNLGIVVLGLRPDDRRIRRLLMAAAGIIFIAAILSLVSHVMGADPDALSRFRATRPNGGFGFAMASASLFLIARGRARVAAGLLAMAVTGLGMITVLGMIYGGAVVSGGAPVPLAVAVMALTIGFGLLTADGDRTWPNHALVGDSVQAMMLRWLLPLVTIVVLVTDLATNFLFSETSPAIGSALNTILSAIATIAVTSYLGGMIGGRLERTNAALRESEERFTRVFKFVPAGISVTRLEDGTFLDSNDEFTRIFGFTAAEVHGRTTTELGIWPDQVTRGNFFQAVMSTAGEIRDSELHLHAKGGRPVSLRVSAQLLDIRGEKLLVTSFVDVTDRKRAEEALTRSERQFSTIFHQNPVGLTVTEVDSGVFVEVNDAYLRHCAATSRDEIIGKTTIELGLLTAEVREEIRENVRNGRMHGLVVPARNLRGEERTTELSVSVYEVDGKRYQLVSVIDITDRVRLERANRLELAERRRVSRRLDLALDAGHIGVWEFNPSSGLLHGDDRLLALYDLTPRDDGAVPFDAWVERVHPADRMLVMPQFERVLGGELQASSEFRVNLPDGTVRYVAGTAALLPADEENPALVVGLNVDITDRKKAELELREYQTGLEELVHTRTTELRAARDVAEGASKAKGTFLAHMSHEIRTPMNAILGYAQLLRTDDTLAPAHRRKVEAIHSSGDHLLGLLNDILEMSRIEAGRTTASREPCDLHTLLDTVRSMFAELAARRGIALDVQLAPGLVRGVITDEGKVRQVLINLLGNAAKFTDHGGITLRVSSRMMGTEQCEVVAEVQDTGAGISDDDQEVIFTPFGQAEEGRRRSGTGLGLAISRSFARLLDGDLTVTSELGRGSTFRFTFVAQVTSAPLVAERDKSMRRQRLDPAESRRRVLIVDDVASNRDVLQETLARAGFEVRLAESGEDALQQYPVWLPHLVLMDLHMPGMGGLSAIRQLRRAGAKATIVVTTAAAERATVDEAKSAGADGLVPKPYREEDLFFTIARAMGIRFDESAVPAAQPSEAGGPSDLAALLQDIPSDLADELRSACRQARAGKVVELADRVAEHSQAAARSIRELADSFRYQVIVEAIDRGSNVE